MAEEAPERGHLPPAGLRRCLGLVQPARKPPRTLRPSGVWDPNPPPPCQLSHPPASCLCIKLHLKKESSFLFVPLSFLNPPQPSSGAPFYRGSPRPETGRHWFSVLAGHQLAPSRAKPGSSDVTPLSPCFLICKRGGERSHFIRLWVSGRRRKPGPGGASGDCSEEQVSSPPAFLPSLAHADVKPLTCKGWRVGIRSPQPPPTPKTRWSWGRVRGAPGARGPGACTRVRSLFPCPGLGP